ncbi:MAG: hypothetical protein Q7U57_11505 [Methylovulum sp.]|nr:hypothetical protein [Methylovulum sp.]
MKLLIIVIAVFFMANEAFAANQKLVQNEAINYVGCYEITLGPWLPDINLGKDEEIFITPPKKIELQKIIGKSDFEKGKLSMRAVLGTRASIHQTSWWELKKKNKLYLVWSTGRSGLTMYLYPTESNLRGFAESFWDFNRGTQRSEVFARSIPCIK